MDDEYARAGVFDPKILITTSRDPSSRLQQFSKVCIRLSTTMRVGYWREEHRKCDLYSPTHNESTVVITSWKISLKLVEAMKLRISSFYMNTVDSQVRPLYFLYKLRRALTLFDGQMVWWYVTFHTVLQPTFHCTTLYCAMISRIREQYQKHFLIWFSTVSTPSWDKE